MMWFKRWALVVRHERAPTMTDAEVRKALEGQTNTPTVRAVQELAERLVWTYVNAARNGDALAVARLDAVMELQAWLAEYAAPAGKEAQG